MCRRLHLNRNQKVEAHLSLFGIICECTKRRTSDDPAIILSTDRDQPKSRVQSVSPRITYQGNYGHGFCFPLITHESVPVGGEHLGVYLSLWLSRCKTANYCQQLRSARGQYTFVSSLHLSLLRTCLIPSIIFFRLLPLIFHFFIYFCTEGSLAVTQYCFIYPFQGQGALEFYLKVPGLKIGFLSNCSDTSQIPVQPQPVSGILDTSASFQNL